jgi:hypothetical protein
VVSLPCLAAVEVPLVVNGDFTAADPADARRPLGWDLPDGLGVSWLDAPGTGHGKAIRMDTRVSERDMVTRWQELKLDWNIPDPATSPVSDTYGLSYYSAAFPAKSGQAYRVSWSFIGNAGGVKVWVRGYGPGTEGGERRIFEAVSEGGQHLAGASPDWRSAGHCFHPTRMTPKVTSLKVMLFAYHPAGVYWFDDLRVEEISDATYAEYRRNAGK